MRYGTISRVNPDSTVQVRFVDGYDSESVATINSYVPVQFEQVVVAEVDGELVCLGSVYNRASDLGEQS